MTFQGTPPQDLMYPVDAFIEASSTHQDMSTVYEDTIRQSHALSNFFEQIMVTHSDFLATDFSHPPIDLNTWLPESDWCQEVDIFAADFVPAIDETFSTPPVDTSRQGETTTPGSTANPEARINNSSDAVRRRHALFRQSPWFWVPKRNQNAFSDEDGIVLDQGHVDLALSPHQPHASSIIVPGSLSQQSRDRILQLVVKTAHSQVSISSFPSADCLEKLIKVGIVKRTEADAWIHPYTFDAETTRPEFLTALVVAGCICFGIPSVNKTGLLLQEIVRVSLQELAERDNSAMRDLQYLQASMLWIDIGAFCGFRRKMILAESSLQTLVTALRRGGRFDAVRYPIIHPALEDDVEQVKKKWREWLEYESYKRLVYHLFEHDIYMAMVNHRKPLLSYAELSLPLPASDSLWLAPTAPAWRARCLEASLPNMRPSMRSILQEVVPISCLPASVDLRIARTAFIHGQASQIWEHMQQAVLLHEMSDPSAQLWSRTRQQRLHQSLLNIEVPLHSSSALICVFQNFLHMYLHVDLDLVTRFAGRSGEEAAHCAYIALQSWFKTRDARTAIAYAGQVLHAARSIPPYQNRGQDSFIIYHSTIVLWTYSMMISDHARKTGVNTPTQQPACDTNGSSRNLVFLDTNRSTNQAVVDNFISTNTGLPCLQILPNLASAQGSEETEPMGGEICNLNCPWQVMRAGVALLDGSHPDVDRDTGPPLLRALCGLMEELGGLRSTGSP
ncbi:hypothetical protein ACEQ8H_006987 [Pleosporales sp. CAS-2024a]